MQKNKLLYNILTKVVVVLITFGLTYSQALYSFDKIFADPLYQQPTAVDKNISIIAIDEKTLQEYGDIGSWGRDIPAKLVETLNGNSEYAPSVICFDVMYISGGEADDDKRFAEVCGNYDNVITAANIVKKAEVTVNSDNKLVVDDDHTEMVEVPYEALRKVTEYGFANTVQDTDGYIRYARITDQYEGEDIESLAYKVYGMYCEKTGMTVEKPDTDDSGLFGFTYSGKSGAYEVISLCDILSGKVDSRAFAGKIVMVGAYAPGMQDAYNVPNQKGTQMYGVEIHANIVEALLENKTGLPVPELLYSVIVTLIVLAFMILAERFKILPGTIILVVLIAADIITGKMLYGNGHIMRIIELPIMSLIVYAYQLIFGYLEERLRRRKTVNAFKKYVAPQVVDTISKQGDFNIVLGGENRHIAVLFVDIRGFTPLSESLEPEQIVEILNEYLNLTTNSIFKNGGTLDKFVGDATMAVFNAPFDLDDYVYRAVCTAKDIVDGSKALNDELEKKFGKRVGFGVGVNCGNAVVGNIGCDFRMDYTAIGDTVNTAARLESNAKAAQVLISEAVYEAVKDRIEVSEVGVIPLKGKSNGVFVYSLEDIPGRE